MMKRSEIVTGTSVKYEAVRLRNLNTNKVVQDEYTLVGMFMELPHKSKSQFTSGVLKELPGTFVGYIKGSSQLKTLQVYLVNSDNEVVKLKEYYKNYEFLFMNINRLSATRMPKNVSDYLKKLHKKYQSNVKLKLEVDRLNAQTTKNNQEIVNLAKEITKDLEKTVEVDYSTIPNMELLEIVERELNKKNLNKDLEEIVAVEKDGDQSLTIMFDLESLYNPKEFELYEDGDGGVSAEKELTKEEIFKLLDRKEIFAIKDYMYELSRVAGITYTFDLETEISEDFTVYLQGYIKIKLTTRENLDETINKLASILTGK